MPRTLERTNGSGVGECVVDVGLGGEVDDGIGLGDELAHQVRVGDVPPLHQPDLRVDRGQGLPAAA